MKRTTDPIHAQQQRVREAYERTGSVNPEYEREFDKLSQMRAVKMAAEFRAERGLPPSAPTPYDPPGAKARRMGDNEFGLDVGYFSEVVRRDLSDLSRKRPEELARICLQMAETAYSQILGEQEFVSAFAKELGLNGTHLRRDAALGELLRELIDKAPKEWGVSLRLAGDGATLTLIAPDQQEQVVASALAPDSTDLREALASLVRELETGERMRAYAERAATQSVEWLKPVLWRLAMQEGDESEARKLLFSFDDYQAFEDWYTTLNNYDLDDEDLSLSAGDRAAMRIAFHQLRSEVDPLNLIVEQVAEQSVGWMGDEILHPRGA